MSRSFTQVLPASIDPRSTLQGPVSWLANFKTEVFTPVNTTTVLTLGNKIIRDFERVYKNGLRLAPTAYTVLAKTITLGVAANGTDQYVIDYYFTTSL